MAAGTQAGAFHPLVAFADLDRALAALEGATIAIEGDDELAAHLARDGRGDRRRAGPARTRGRRRPTTRRRCSRRAASSRCWTRSARWPRRSGSTRPGRWRSTCRCSSRPSPTPGRSGIDRALTGSGHPRRRRDHRGAPRRHRRGCPRRDGRLLGRCSRATSPSPNGVAPCHRMRPNACGPHLRPTPDAVRCGHAAQHCRTSRGLAAARFVHPSSRARERQLGLRPSTAFTAASARRTVLRRPDVGPLTAVRAPWRALTIAPARPVRSGRPAPASAMLWTSDTRAGRSAALLRGAGVARLKQAVATSAGGIVIRFVRGRPRSSSSASASASATGSPGPCPRARPTRGETTEETAIREVREETRPRGPDRAPVRLDRVLVRPGPDADPQDRPLLPHGSRPAATSAATTTSSTRSAGSASTRRRPS